MATPQIPSRPARSSQAPAAQSSEAALAPQPPQIPQRPAGRRQPERSVSPTRDRYAPSPLNAPVRKSTSGAADPDNNPYGSSGKNFSGSNLQLSERPPSVSLPSIGQEGNEYESYSEYEADPLSRTVSNTQTTHVATDLPLHAPVAGLAQSEARARVQGVTQSDNSIPPSPAGRRASANLDDPSWRPLRSRASAQLRSPSAASTERPHSVRDEEHGIPQIGIQVPMFRHAGDVQAPSPAPGYAAAQEGGRPRHHNRRSSARDTSNPPDSYGRHGHGILSTDKFEKDWYAKHPEALAQEGHYSPALNGARRDYVLSSEELNKLVRGSGGAGFGTKPDVVGLPDEQIGYMASEEYASRMSTRPSSSYATPASTAPNSGKLDSLLRKVQSHDGSAQPEINELTRTTTGGSEIIHIDAPDQHWNKVTGGGGVSTPPVDLGPHGGNTSERGGFYDEQGYGIPILASDEIRPDSAWQRPAISPIPQDRDGDASLRNNFGSRPSSRPGSRPGSIHGTASLQRFDSHDEYGTHTPLDDVEEYEPLFEDDDKPKKLVTEVTRLKHRPDIKHRFPSQDIWEDSPDSAHFQTEVDTPEPEEDGLFATPAATSSTFESPEAEATRKGEPSEADRARLIPKEQRLAESDFKPQIRRDLRRPGTQRFPSSDVWEDSPDSARLETTVGDTDEHEEHENPADVAGATVTTSTDREDLSGHTSRAGATAGAPIVPQRPVRPLKHKSSQPKEHSHLSEVYNASAEGSQLPVAEIQRSTPPSIPDRPKPQVPARPNRSDATSPPEASPRAKPPVPARPMGSKIAALQSGFMSDLNNRLKLGPHAPPKPTEPEKNEDESEEKAPLEDARKGRARGPARRKPAASPAAAPTPAPALQGKRMPKLSFAKPITVWHISPKGALDVVYETPEPPIEEPKQKTTTITEKALDSSDDSHTENTAIPTRSAEASALTASSKEELGSDDIPGAFPSTPASETLPSTTQTTKDNVVPEHESYEDATVGTDAPSQEAVTSPLEGLSSPTQTGTKDIEINPGTAGSQKLTVIEGGHAQTGQDVVIKAETPKDDEGHLRKDLA